MSTNNVRLAIENGRKTAFVTGSIVIALGVAVMAWRALVDPSQVPIIAIALVVVALIVVPLLLSIVSRRKAQSVALSSTRPHGTLHFPSPTLTATKQAMRIGAATVGTPVAGKGLQFAPSISVEPDGIRGWSGGKNLVQEFFYPRENITEIAPFFMKEGVRTFPAIVVGLFGEWMDETPEPNPRTEDYIVPIPVGSVPGDAYSEHGGYERAEAIARESARILGVGYLSPEELEERIRGAKPFMGGHITNNS